MRKTGGDERRRVEMRIIDSLCKQWFLTADGTKRNSYRPCPVAVSFFINLHKNTHNECRYIRYRKDSYYAPIFIIR